MLKKARKEFYKYALWLPGIVLFGFAIAVPFFMGANIALTDWNGITKDYNYIGFDNFGRALKNAAILPPLLNTLKFGLFGTLTNNVAALGLALLVCRKMRGADLFKTVFFIPLCLSTVLVAFTWKYIYREVVPFVFGMNNPLGDPQLAIPAIILMSVWSTVGINMLIYTAGLKNVPKDLYEAAVVDGASTWKRFCNITLPMIMPSFTVCVTLTLTSYLREFSMTLSSTGGGPAGASETLAIYIYQNFYEFSKAGYAQAVSILFMLVLVLIGLSVSSFFRKKEVEL